jgi:hypothetical protein
MGRIFIFRWFFILGQKILISNRHNSVRKGFVLFMSNFILFAGILFAVEIAVILLGIGNIFLPWTRQALDLLNRVLF